MLTGKDLDALIGRIGRLTIDGPKGQKASGRLRVTVVVIDAKVAWGHVRYKVRPHDTRADSGAVWVGSSRVALDPVQEKRVGA